MFNNNCKFILEVNLVVKILTKRENGKFILVSHWKKAKCRGASKQTLVIIRLKSGDKI